MQITIELVGFLAQARQAQELRAGLIELPEDASLGDALALAGVAPDMPLMATVNGMRAVPGQRLRDGDVVRLVPPIGGG
jgi:molybdopterin converting factor small subunit